LGDENNDISPTDNDSDDFVLDTDNSSVTTTASQVARADLAVAFGNGSTPGDQPDPVTPGNDVLYTIKVTNNGPAAASLKLTDSIVGGTFGQVPATGSGAGWSCSVNGAGTGVTCTHGSLASGASAVLQAWVHGPSAAPTTAIACGSGTVKGICNTASVSGSQPDPNTANNTARQATTVSSACPTTDTSCARSFINYALPSTVTSGSAASAARWLVGTQLFPATSYTGGQLFSLDALNTPEAACPATLGGGLGVLTQCTFEMSTSANPSQYAGKSITLKLECDLSHCPVSASGTPGGFVLVKIVNGTPQLLTRCDSILPTTPCYTTGVSPSNGNFQVTIEGITAGDPRYAGKCYIDCTPALP
jgi:hypothetical protein